MSQRAPPTVHPPYRLVRWRWAAPPLYGSTMMIAALALACGSEPPTGPGPGPPPGPTVAAISVTSPIDTLLALGHPAQLSASVTDANGNAMSGVTITWTTSDPAVATVNASGLVTPVAPGSVDIIAAAEGVTGRLRMRMIDADLTVIGGLINDLYVRQLVNRIEDDASNALLGEIAVISSGVIDGNCAAVYQAVRDALSAIDLAQPTLQQPGDPTLENERVMLAVLELAFVRAEQLLNL